MPRTQKRNLLTSGKIKFLVAVIAGGLVLFGLALAAESFVDASPYRETVQRIVKERTGRDLVVKGAAKISLLPVPTLYLPNVELVDESDVDRVTPMLTARMMQIRPTLTSLFSSTPAARSIILQGAVLEIVRAQDHVIHWDWINASLLKKTDQSQGEEAVLAVEDGQISYYNSTTDHTFLIPHVNAYITGGEQPQAGGSLSLYGRTLNFAVNLKGNPLHHSDVPLDVSVYMNDKNRLTLRGKADWTGEKPKMDGSLQLALENPLVWVEAKSEKQEAIFPMFVQEEPAPSETKQFAVAVQFTSDWAQEGASVHLTNGQFSGLNSAGAGKISIDWPDKPVIAVDMKFSALDYNQWQSLLAALYANAQTETDNSPFSRGEEAEDTTDTLPANIEISLNIVADQLYANQQIWRKADMQIKLAEAAVTVNRLYVELPGESTLSLFGIITQGKTKGFRFEGNMETQGKNLRQFLTAFESSAADLPEAGFGSFYARSNLYFAPDQVRLSEADVQIEDLKLAGGLVAYGEEADRRFEAEIKLQDINFDYFRDAWREKNKDSKEKTFFLKPERQMNFNWLRKLTATFDFKINVENFTFLDRKGDNATFRFYAKKGEFGIYNVRFNYPDEMLEASFTLDVNSGRPFVNVLLSADTIDTDYFRLAPLKTLPEKSEKVSETKKSPSVEKQDITIVPQAKQITEAAGAEPPPAAETEDLSNVAAKKPSRGGASKNRWSEELVDTGWMDGINGVFDISVNKLIYGDRIVEKLKTRTRVENGLVTFEGLSFTHWQGRCDVTGSFYGGKVPGFSVGFTLYNVELRDMMKALAGVESLSGKVSVSGTLSTSGVNYSSWVSQAEAKLILAGRGVTVAGFNLPGVLDAIKVSRTAADVLTNVNLALRKGSTQMTVDGVVNIKNGVLRSPGITLKTASILGGLSGDVRLIPWTMELAGLFQFPDLDPDKIPTMAIELKGPIEKPTLQADTASLEAFVTKQLIGR